MATDRRGSLSDALLDVPTTELHSLMSARRANLGLDVRRRPSVSQQRRESVHIEDALPKSGSETEERRRRSIREALLREAQRHAEAEGERRFRRAQSILEADPSAGEFVSVNVALHRAPVRPRAAVRATETSMWTAVAHALGAVGGALLIGLLLLGVERVLARQHTRWGSFMRRLWSWVFSDATRGRPLF